MSVSELVRSTRPSAAQIYMAVAATLMALAFLLVGWVGRQVSVNSISPSGKR